MSELDAKEMKRKVEEYFDNVTHEQLLKDIERSDPEGIYRRMQGSFWEEPDERIAALSEIFIAGTLLNRVVHCHYVAVGTKEQDSGMDIFTSPEMLEEMEELIKKEIKNEESAGMCRIKELKKSKRMFLGIDWKKHLVCLLKILGRRGHRC